MGAMGYWFQGSVVQGAVAGKLARGEGSDVWIAGQRGGIRVHVGGTLGCDVRIMEKGGGFREELG